MRRLDHVSKIPVYSGGLHPVKGFKSDVIPEQKSAIRHRVKKGFSKWSMPQEPTGYMPCRKNDCL